MYQCEHCKYESMYKYNVDRHLVAKHKQLKTETYQAHRNYASHHPYGHPYLSNANQQVNTYPQRTPWMVANNMEYGAPTVMSVGPNGPRAPTTVSVPPVTGGVQQGGSALGVNPNSIQRGSGIGDQFHRPPQNSIHVGGLANNRAPTTYREHGPTVRAPTTVSVPPHRYQHGTGIDETEESDSEEEENENALRYQHGTGIDEKEESDSEEEENENVSDINDILRDISKTFTYLQQLREQYRDALPQIRELEGEDMESFLECYANFKAYVLEEQEGLEGTVCAKKTQHGKDVDDTEDDETDEEAVDPGTDGSDADTEEGDTDEESMDTEVEDIVDDAEIEDIEFEFDKIEEEEICKEQFFDFVFEAENFLDSKSKDKLGKDLAEEKRYLKICNGFEQGLTDLPQAVDDVIEDLGDLIEEWNERDGKCFKTCSKRKIHSLSNVANTLVDSELLMKMKKINTPKYKFLRKMLKPHVKSVEKLADSNVSIHEKRKTLQKSQVGEGILEAAANLVIPYLERAKKYGPNSL
jgi:hypothetical protein